MFRNSPVGAWRNQSHRYRLEGVICTECNKKYYPKKYVCSCGGMTFVHYLFSGRGTLLSFSQIYVPPIEFIAVVPYCIGLVELEEGPRLVAQVTDVKIENLTIGMHLETAFRRYFTAGDEGMIFYGLKFIPADV